MKNLFAVSVTCCVSVFSMASAEDLSFDSDVTLGTLENGMRYFIRENARPEGRLELRLVVGAGSALEADDQQGLAHYLEHMAFNGSRHFKKQELVDYLESIGMSFGSHLNAYTSFDETVYMLQVPTEKAEVVDKAFLVLQDWASGMALTDEEIEKERGVIIEEWRGRLGAQQRLRDKHFPVLFKGSIYADRMPIGKMDVIESFEFERMRAYYAAWYRPDLMSVIAVGDMDAAEIEARIKATFSGIDRSGPEVEDFELPDFEGTRVSIQTDPEAANASLSVYFKLPAHPVRTREDYRTALLESLFTGMLNGRLNELRQKADPPFVAGYSFKSGFIETASFFGLGGYVKEDGYVRGLEALLTEAERVQRHGFTAGELARQKSAQLRRIEVAYNEREKTESATYATAYIESALRGGIEPGIEAERDLYQALLAEIGLGDVNALSTTLITDDSRTVLISGPETAEPHLPSEEDVLALFQRVDGAELGAYADDVGQGSLLIEGDATSRVVSRSHDDRTDVTTWVLGNGARVMVKQTDFKADEIRMSAWSPGGTSLVSDDDFISASHAGSLVGAGGVGGFSLVQLGKELAGKRVKVAPSIGENAEGFSGSCAPAELELMLALVRQYQSAPRRDEEAIASIKVRQKAMLKNRLLRPGAVFFDEVTRVLYRDHPRRQPASEATIDAIDDNRAFAFYADRFASFHDFTFLFVGAVDPEVLEPLVCKYLGDVPAVSGRDPEIWGTDVGVRLTDETGETVVRKGIEQKAQVMHKIWGDFEFTYPNRYALQSMIAALQIRLREEIREELGGTYSIGAYPQMTHYPVSTYQINIVFGCNPDKVDTLRSAVQGVIDELQSTPLEATYVTKVQEQQRRKREVDLKTNGFWASVLKFYDVHDEDPWSIFDFDELVDGLNAEKLQAAARTYLGSPRSMTFLLLPE